MDKGQSRVSLRQGNDQFSRIKQNTITDLCWSCLELTAGESTTSFVIKRTGFSVAGHTSGNSGMGTETDVRGRLFAASAAATVRETDAKKTRQILIGEPVVTATQSSIRRWTQSPDFGRGPGRRRYLRLPTDRRRTLDLKSSEYRDLTDALAKSLRQSLMSESRLDESARCRMSMLTIGTESLWSRSGTGQHSRGQCLRVLGAYLPKRFQLPAPPCHGANSHTVTGVTVEH